MANDAPASTDGEFETLSTDSGHRSITPERQIGIRVSARRAKRARDALAQSERPKLMGESSLSCHRSQCDRYPVA